MIQKKLGRPRIALPVDDIIDDYVRGRMSMRAIAERYGVACWTVRERLQLAQVARRPRGGLTRAERQRYAERKAAGHG